MKLDRRALGTGALYTVVAIEDDLVEVEVVSAPGLTAGQRVKFTAGDVRAMARIAAAATRIRVG